MACAISAHQTLILSFLKRSHLDQLKETLSVFRIGITVGLIAREKLVEWIRKTVANEKKPPRELTDLLTLDPKASLVITFNLLDKLIGPAVPENAGKIVMRMIYDELKAGKISPVKAVQLAYHASMESNQDDAEQAYLSDLDDEGYLIQLGTSQRDEKELEADILQFLSQYESYSFSI
jgi:hypothetical protein